MSHLRDSNIESAHVPELKSSPLRCRLQVMMQELRREVAILQRVSADANVVQFYGAVLDGSAALPAMLVMEYLAVSGYDALLRFQCKWQDRWRTFSPMSPVVLVGEAWRCDLLLCSRLTLRAEEAGNCPRLS